jgi:hypothetical protein
MHYNNYISCHKDKMFFHLNYWHDDNRRVGVAMSLKAQVQVKTLFMTNIYIFLPSALWDKKAIAELNSPTHHEGWIVSDQEIMFCSI